MDSAVEEPASSPPPPQEESKNASKSPEQSTPMSSDQSTVPTVSMDSMEKLREAHRLRKARRGANRPPPSPTIDADSADSGNADKDSESPVDSAAMKKLHAELTTARLEMSSMRRNHVTNVQKLKQERDMFALQLAQEQEQADPESVRGIESLRTELKTVKMRNANLEEENAQMRGELKELKLRLTATRTLDAQQSGYEAVVTDLITVKLQCANLSEDKETLVRENRNMKTDNDALSTANGLLEKSRSEWVLKCAQLESKLRAMEEADPSDSTPQRTNLQPLVNQSPSQNSDLQELSL